MKLKRNSRKSTLSNHKSKSILCPLIKSNLRKKDGKSSLNLKLLKGRSERGLELKLKLKRHRKLVHSSPNFCPLVLKVDEALRLVAAMIQFLCLKDCFMRLI
jgi:hypothetical protein